MCTDCQMAMQSYTCDSCDCIDRIEALQTTTGSNYSETCLNQTFKKLEFCINQTLNQVLMYDIFVNLIL